MQSTDHWTDNADLTEEKVICFPDMLLLQVLLLQEVLLANACKAALA